ncbi:MAG: hypothetical protein LBC40_04905 [Dysgonamonadaceae bacterium]|jgi:hypothetical protein|nr:hypothetical protein [Dysgonamonadaceae bacterium]
MEEVEGISYTNDATGRKRYLQIDLDVYGENPLIEEFLDSLDTEARRAEEAIRMEEFNQYLEKKLTSTWR